MARIAVDHLCIAVAMHHGRLSLSLPLLVIGDVGLLPATIVQIAFAVVAIMVLRASSFAR